MTEKRSWIVDPTSALPLDKSDIRQAYLQGRDAARAGNIDLRNARASELGFAGFLNEAIAVVAFAGAGLNLFVSLRNGSAWHGFEAAYDATAGTIQAMAAYTQSFLSAKLLTMEPTPETAVANPADFIPPDYKTHPSFGELAGTTFGMLGIWATVTDGVQDTFF